MATIAAPDRAEPQSAADETACRWLLHFPDSEALEVCFWPEAKHADVLADYPEAIAAEPIPEPDPAEAPADLGALFDECLRAGLYDEAERALPPGMVAADLAGTRSLLTDMQGRIGRRHAAGHFRRAVGPATAGARGSAPCLTGSCRPLYTMSADGGTWCQPLRGAIRPDRLGLIQFRQVLSLSDEAPLTRTESYLPNDERHERIAPTMEGIAAPKGNQNAVGNPGGPGAPSKYRVEFAAQAEKACQAGVTDQEFADVFDVSVRLIKRCKIEQVEFCAPLKTGKDEADDRVERSLYARAIGYEHDQLTCG